MSQTCSAGYFGEDCSLQCNCLDNSCKNTVDSPGCITGLCSPGYTGFPACQTQCKSGYFGLECAEKCSCTPENRCSPTNGNCIPPNRCTPDRIGPGCKILRSKLNTPPFLGVNCTSLVISWSLFNESIDSGASDVRKYRIELRSPNSEKFSELQMVPRENSTDGVFQVTVADVAPGDGYCVRIVPIFFLDTGGGDGYLADGIASPPSRKVSVAKEEEDDDHYHDHKQHIHADDPDNAHHEHTHPHDHLLANYRWYVVVCAGYHPCLASHYSNLLRFIQLEQGPTTPTEPEHPPGRRLTGPRNCVLIGLGRTWAVFKWDRALSACGLGDLTGYELRLSTAGGGGDNVVVKSYPSDAFTAVKVVEDLDEGTEYRVQIFATYERGSVACSDTSEEAFETYLEASGSSLLQLRVLERRHDRFVVRLLADSLIGPTRLWFHGDLVLGNQRDCKSQDVKETTASSAKKRILNLREIWPTKAKCYVGGVLVNETGSIREKIEGGQLGHGWPTARGFKVDLDHGRKFDLVVAAIHFTEGTYGPGDSAVLSIIQQRVGGLLFRDQVLHVWLRSRGALPPPNSRHFPHNTPPSGVLAEAAWAMTHAGPVTRRWPPRLSASGSCAVVRLAAPKPDLAAYFVVTASSVESRLPTPVSLGVASVESATSVMRQFSFTTDIHAATKYRLYAWAAPTDGDQFQGVTAELWTLPKPFTTSPNFVIHPPSFVELLDYTAKLWYPSISGYVGGPITDYYLAVSPGRVAPQTNPVVKASRNILGNQTVIRSRLSLPPTATIAFHSRAPPNQPIVIGDGVVVRVWPAVSLPLGLFADPPLAPDTEYTLFVAVASSLDEGDGILSPDCAVSPANVTHFRTAALRSRAPSRAAVTSIAVAVLLLVFVILSAMGWCLMRHTGVLKKPKHYSLNLRPKRCPSGALTKPGFGDSMSVLPKSYGAWSFPLNLRDPRFLVIDPERGPDNTLLGTKCLREIADSFLREYNSLPVNKALPQSHANKAVNRGKNRSREALPYDHNRVKLKRSMNSPETDYINASFVDSYMRRKAYIAAQSPFNATTACDFWTMIVQCNISQIVFLTNQIEDGAVRCTKYWPDVDKADIFSDKRHPASERQYDSIMVQALDVVEYAHFSVRRFQVTDLNAGATHFVIQYHYHSWFAKSNAASSMFDSYGKVTALGSTDRVSAELSERDAGFDHLAFIDFYFHVKMATRLEDGPILVHCEDGVSRTSVFVAFDTLFQQLMHEHAVTVPRVCSSLRRARPNMIPTPRHFAVLYDLLFEAGIAGHSLVDLDVRSALKTLSQRNVAAGFTYLTEQWYLLHNYTPSCSRKTEVIDALSPINTQKNRYPNLLDFLPPDCFRPRIPPGYNSVEGTSDYVNAVYVDGLAVKEDLILTQTPMPNTVEAFWTLVFEERVTCIVDMEPYGYGSDNAVCYWPTSTEDSLLSTELEEPINTFTFFPAQDTDNIVDSDEEASIPRDVGAWFQVAGFQLAQVGKLTAVRRPGCSETGRRVVFKRQMLIRRILSQTSPAGRRRAEVRTVNIFHFRANWKQGGQVPSRAHFLQLLEVFSIDRGLGPAVVHCLDGATRSGLFVANHLLAEKITRDHFVDLFHTLKSLKLRRRAVIGSVCQLRFTYRVLVDWVDMVVNKPLATQKTAYPMSLLRDSMPTPRGSRLGATNRSVFSSRVSLDSTYTMCGDANASNSFNEEGEDRDASPPRSVVVLYRYFNDELSRIVKNRTALPATLDSSGNQPNRSRRE
ncbi:unnamed protein product [Mesocestoides corti]|uniref:protein-tyrosine-phosphatase n=2 Tax=Mesocestoides corti TaxID=53468 RepID=A0A158QTY4_MESCO|nr:unnamed protein product [Mesocestoides corti]